MTTTSNSILITLAFALFSCQSTGQSKTTDTPPAPKEQNVDHSNNPYYSETDKTKLDVPLSEWKAILPADLYHVAFEQGTERPFTGKFKEEHSDGIFRCAVCGNSLFTPETKFESGTGWPSFYKPLSEDQVVEHSDGSLGMMRTEVVCSRCDAHLGHVFDDGPEPTGLRYCINAVSLDLTSK